MDFAFHPGFYSNSFFYVSYTIEDSEVSGVWTSVVAFRLARSAGSWQTPSSIHAPTHARCGDWPTML